MFTQLRTGVFGVLRLEVAKIFGVHSMRMLSVSSSAETLSKIASGVSSALGGLSVVSHDPKRPRDRFLSDTKDRYAAANVTDWT